MHANLETLREKVLEIARRSKLSRIVESVSLEADHDEDGTEFLRVLVSVKDIEQTTDDELEAFLETVEQDVGGLDPRYPSVRFLDAAL